jgi:hypothetical protein
MTQCYTHVVHVPIYLKFQMVRLLFSALLRDMRHSAYLEQSVCAPEFHHKSVVGVVEVVVVLVVGGGEGWFTSIGNQIRRR